MTDNRDIKDLKAESNIRYIAGTCVGFFLGVQGSAIELPFIRYIAIGAMFVFSGLMFWLAYKKRVR